MGFYRQLGFLVTILTTVVVFIGCTFYGALPVSVSLLISAGVFVPGSSVTLYRRHLCIVLRQMIGKTLRCIRISPQRTSPGRAFYEEKLGFKPKDVSAGGVTYDFANGTACFLYPTPNAGTSQAGQAFWRVENIEKEVTDLMARGVKFEKYDMPTINEKGISTAGGAKAAWFKDKKGNIMALIQTL